MAEEKKRRSIQGLTLDQLRRRRWLQSRRRVLAVGISGLVIVVVAVWLLYFSSVFAVEHVSVTGAQAISASDIQKFARVPYGTPLIDADLGAIRHRIEALPGVASASVSRSWPQTISITVVERTPVAVVTTSGGLRNIDESGVIFGHRNQRPAGLPLIQLSGSVDQSALKGAATVAGSLPRSILRQVTSISVRSMDDIRLNLTNGRQVLWGSAADSAIKAQVATALLRHHNAIVDVSVPSNPTTG